MKVFVIRHGKVNYKWSRRCTSKEYDKECLAYDAAPVEALSNAFSGSAFQELYVSTLPRSRDTAEMLFPGRLPRTTACIDEVPLRSGFDTGMKLPLWFWNFTGRMQWFFNHPRQPEGRRCTEERARRFVDIISKENADCAVVTHGFFMHTLLHEMKKNGFKINRSRLIYKNEEVVSVIKRTF